MSAFTDVADKLHREIYALQDEVTKLRAQLNAKELSRAEAWSDFLDTLKPSERATVLESAKRGESLTHRAFLHGLLASNFDGSAMVMGYLTQREANALKVCVNDADRGYVNCWTQPGHETDVPVYAAPGAALPWNHPSVAIGSWLAAALDDPSVCKEMKEDINRWMNAGFPLPDYSDDQNKEG